MKTIAVIPAWNEASRIGGAILGVKPFVDGIIVVDDGSTDGTGDAARQMGVTVFRHLLNRGQGAALKTGTVAALRMGADIIVHVDADGQHDPGMIPMLTGPIQRGEADVVLGSRFLGVDPTGMPLVRKLYFIAARTFNTLLLGISRRVTDPQSGARAMSRQAADRIEFKQDRAAHCSEILRQVTRGGFRWMEVPIHVRYSAETIAKGQKFSSAFQIVWHLIIRGVGK